MIRVGEEAGFSGARHGATPQQVVQLARLFRKDGISRLHHGASPLRECADWQAGDVAHNLGIPVVLHPPNCKPEDPQPVRAKAMRARNKVVVDQTARLYACPDGFIEKRRSGTWMTVRYARELGRPITTIWPDGRVTREQGGS